MPPQSCAKNFCACLAGEPLLSREIGALSKKDILSFLSRGVKVIAVTGTNGKTTTARIIETGLKKAGKSCFLNRSGANLITGVTAAFISNCDIHGRCRYEYAVLECDEMH